MKGLVWLLESKKIRYNVLADTAQFSMRILVASRSQSDLVLMGTEALRRRHSCKLCLALRSSMLLGFGTLFISR